MVARHDQVTDPAVLEALGTVRLGTSYFRRALSRLSDDDFYGPSLLPGWSRRHLVAHVGYNARAVARLVIWATTGVETPMYSSPQARQEEIEFGATLRPDALRSLCEHAAIELDVRWRDLPDERWAEKVVTAQGRTVPVSETLWMRTREVWLHAVDLGVDERIDEIPEVVLERLLGDIVGMWERRDELDGLALSASRVDGSPIRFGAEADARATLSGPLASVVAWASGRECASTGAGLSWAGEVRVAPRWI
jgi:maleylpyruvate isomerase